jgi:hypothetical protein
MLRLEDFAADRRTITIQVALGETTHHISVTYRPSAFTVEFVRSLDHRDAADVVDALVAVLDAWDIEDLDATDPAQVGRLPAPFLLRLFGEIRVDAFVGKVNGSSSPAGSRPARRANRTART